MMHPGNKYADLEISPKRRCVIFRSRAGSYFELARPKLRVRGEACLRSACVATRGAACAAREVRGQTATSSGGLRTAGEPGRFRGADLAPSGAQRPFEVSLRAAIASAWPKPGGVFAFLRSRAERGSHVRHETEPQEWAESRVSISLWPVHMQRHSDRNHFTGPERDEGWDEW